MTRAKATPGPWHVSEGSSGELNIMSPDNRAVSIIFRPLDFDETTRAANAHLIAAAPDLLAALVEARSAMRLAWSWGDGTPSQRAIAALIAAGHRADTVIAKARGEAKNPAPDAGPEIETGEKR